MQDLINNQRFYKQRPRHVVNNPITYQRDKWNNDRTQSNPQIRHKSIPTIQNSSMNWDTHYNSINSRTKEMSPPPGLINDVRLAKKLPRSTYKNVITGEIKNFGLLGS